MDGVEILGLFSGLCTTVSFLPQVVQVIKSRSTRDISLPMYVILIMGLMGWLAYGIIAGCISMIFANAFTLLLASIILVLKIAWKEK